MLFSTLTFWLFFAAVFATYTVLPHRAQNRMLLVASYVFYAAWDWRFLGLIWLSTVVDYLVALRMDRTTGPTRKRLLIVSICTNLGMLGIFKYLGFFAEGFSDLMSSFGMTPDPLVLSIALPVGISFYTFQTMSYTIDVYRGKLKARTDFLDFALFVAFFPQLVAGPIERASNLLPEIERPRILTANAISRGAVLCLLGLLKKIVIADGIAPSVDAIYSSPAPSGLDVVLATWLFAIQIYCDFSGYTDIARGVAKMLGFGLMRNFAQPYFAADPQEFWRRWHISLSTWLRDYLYIPLGGNRGGSFATYRNLMTTMVLGGLWHGAAWNFVLWGAYQGLLLSIHRALAGRSKGTAEGARPGGWHFLRRIVAIALFFQVVCYGWLLFRAGSFEQIAQFTSLIVSPAAGWSTVSMPSVPFAAILGMVFLFLWDASTEWSGRVRFYLWFPSPVRSIGYATMIYLLAFGATTAPTAFIYFQF